MESLDEVCLKAETAFRVSRVAKPELQAVICTRGVEDQAIDPAISRLTAPIAIAGLDLAIPGVYPNGQILALTDVDESIRDTESVDTLTPMSWRDDETAKWAVAVGVERGRRGALVADFGVVRAESPGRVPVRLDQADEFEDAKKLRAWINQSRSQSRCAQLGMSQFNDS